MSIPTSGLARHASLRNATYSTGTELPEDGRRRVKERRGCGGGSEIRGRAAGHVDDVQRQLAKVLARAERPRGEVGGSFGGELQPCRRAGQQAHLQQRRPASALLWAISAPLGSSRATSAHLGPPDAKLRPSRPVYGSEPTCTSVCSNVPCAPATRSVTSLACSQLESVSRRRWRHAARRRDRLVRARPPDERHRHSPDGVLVAVEQVGDRQLPLAHPAELGGRRRRPPPAAAGGGEGSAGRHEPRAVHFRARGDGESGQEAPCAVLLPAPDEGRAHLLAARGVNETRIATPPRTSRRAARATLPLSSTNWMTKPGGAPTDTWRATPAALTSRSANLFLQLE